MTYDFGDLKSIYKDHLEPSSGSPSNETLPYSEHETAENMVFWIFQRLVNIFRSDRASVWSMYGYMRH